MSTGTTENDTNGELGQPTPKTLNVDKEIESLLERHYVGAWLVAGMTWEKFKAGIIPQLTALIETTSLANWKEGFEAGRKAYKTGVKTALDGDYDIIHKGD